MDFNWITHHLALGGMLRPGKAGLLKNIEIQAVINLCSEALDDEDALRMNGIKYLHLPTPDLCAVSQSMLWQGVNFTRPFILLGEKVLIHCQHGIGRSALLTCCALVSLGHSPLSALVLAKNAREKVSPTPEQLHAFLKWSQCWYEYSALKWPETTWDELAAIAYRHLRPLNDCLR